MSVSSDGTEWEFSENEVRTVLPSPNPLLFKAGWRLCLASRFRLRSVGTERESLPTYAFFGVRPWYSRMTTMCVYLCRDGRKFSFVLSSHHLPTHNRFIPPFPMTANTKSTTSRAIVNTVRAALKLLSSSSEQLSVSQLLALKSDMGKARVVVNSQMQAKQSSTFIENLP